MLAWMLYATVVGACLYVAARALERVLRPARAQRRWVWVLALGFAVVWPLRPSATRGPDAPPSVAAHEAAGTGAATLPLAADRAVPLPVWTVAAPALGRDAWWLALWLVASGLVALRFGHSALRLRRLLHTGRPATMAGEHVVEVDDGAPALVGAWAPQIVVPTWLRDFDAALQALVVAHEAEHRRAGDAWLIHVLALLLIVLPWHLPLWAMGRRLRRAIELDCDARVLARHPDAQRYGRVLLAIAQRRGAGAWALAPALVEPVSLTEERIMAFTKQDRASAWWRAAAALVAVAAVGAACTAERPAAAPPSPDTSGVQTLSSVWIQAPLAETTFVGLTPEGQVEVMARRAEERRAIAERVRAQLDSLERSDRQRMEAFRARMATERERGGAGAVRTEAEVDQPVSALPGSPGPSYPPTLKAQGEEGFVRVQFVIRADSTLDPESVRVLEASHELFANAVRVSLPRMRFRAALVNGRPVDQLVQQPFGFKISR